MPKDRAGVAGRRPTRRVRRAAPGSCAGYLAGAEGSSAYADERRERAVDDRRALAVQNFPEYFEEREFEAPVSESECNIFTLITRMVGLPISFTCK